jgi:glycosyltransferase involved in cell wall biosynthesis
VIGRLVFATQVVDAEHPNLGVTLDLVGALAVRMEEVVVLTGRVGRHALPANVRFRTFGARSRPGRVLRFERAALAELRRRPAGFVAHMVPQYVLLAGPFARALRVPVALWYTHWRASRSLRVATRLADVVLSVDERSFPLETPKVRGIGHAIDLAGFEPGLRRAEDGRLRLLALGKTEPWKGLPLVLDAVGAAAAGGLDVELEIRGPQLTERQRTHRRELEDRVRSEPALRERVRIEDGVARDRLPALLRDADAVVSATAPTDGAEALDKVVYEAAAAGVPVVACNPSLQSQLGPLGLYFRPGDAGDLAARLAALAAADTARREELGRELRRWVESSHSLDRWADAVVEAVASTHRRG